MKAALKRLRYSQPFNRLATGGARSFCRLFGTTPEILPRHLHRVGDVEERLPNGARLRLHSQGDDWVTNQIFWKGWQAYEPGTIDVFYRLAERSEVVLDVGAYVGFFGLVAAHANPNARVFAFEPMKPIWERLVENVRANGLSNMECVNAAVGETDGSARFFFSGSALRDALPTSSSLSEQFMKNAPGLSGVDVRVWTLDAFSEARSLAHVDLIKIDTETTEPSVLRGARAVLARDRPVLICEVLKDRVDVAALEEELRPLGYKYFLLTPDGPLPRTAIEGHPEFLNYMFTTAPHRDLT